MGTRQKVGTGVSVLGIAQGFASMWMAVASSAPSPSLAKWFAVGFVVFLVLGLGIIFWPSRELRATEPNLEDKQSGLDNAQAIAGRDAIAQTGDGPNVVAQDYGVAQSGAQNVSMRDNYGAVTQIIDAAEETADGRFFLQRTPEELVGFYSGFTDQQGEDVTRHFIGSWLKVTRPADQIGAWSSTSEPGFAQVSSYTNSKEGRTHVAMFFLDKQAYLTQVSNLSVGTIVTVEGAIEYVERSQVVLTKCRLIETSWSKQQQIEALERRASEGEAFLAQALADTPPAQLSGPLYAWHQGLKDDFTQMPPPWEDHLVSQSEVNWQSIQSIRKYLGNQISQLNLLRSQLG